MKYKIGEIVAIAQCYEKILSDSTVKPNYHILMSDDLLCETAGWGNKMFVKAEYMPHQIQITDIKLERLQNISNEDCIKEGIYKVDKENWRKPSQPYRCEGIKDTTPRKVFASLIDKVSGKGTWDKNPWVVVYYFKLVK